MNAQKLPGVQRILRALRPPVWPWLLAAAATFSPLAHADLLSWMRPGSGSSPTGDGLTLATWNMEWLMTPAEHDALAARCTAQQPRSDQRALPCTPGRALPPSRAAEDFDVLARTASELRDKQGADVVALQEADGPEAARQVFRKGWQLDCFTRRAHPQKVGFAIRDGVPYRCNGDLAALDIDGGTRPGADISLWPGTAREVRLLAVHLKSGCFSGKLDRSFDPCAKLRQQVPVVEAWVDQRVREGVAFALLGDFNRQLDKDARYPAGPDEAAPFNLFQAWSDKQPAGAELLRASEGQAYVGCDANDRHGHYIDDILIDRKLADRNKNRRYARLPFDSGDQGRTLSDHCPVIWSLKP
jgi:endonuclease/exonuclease/phosphatase family metal-dependent hydrolase